MNLIIDAQGRRAQAPPLGALSFDVMAPAAGVVAGLDNLRLARIARLAGAPQVKGAGIDLRVKLGGTVRAGEPLYRVHAQYDADLQFARQMTERGCAYRIDAAAPAADAVLRASEHPP